ncbi:MAG: hypothetical protein IT357_06520 [Gemmatimonadaceae bacterium]|nr:hypothetical protein [Gemmatimonadaceae bacterium]
MDLTRPASKDEVLAAFMAVSRIAFVRVSDGAVSMRRTDEDLGIRQRFL